MGVKELIGVHNLSVCPIKVLGISSNNFDIPGSDRSLEFCVFFFAIRSGLMVQACYTLSRGLCR